MTRVFYASTLFGAMTVAAGLDAGLFGERSERRLLVVANNVAAPEIVDGFHLSRGFEPLRGRFDDIVDWNEIVAPLHPSKWVPRTSEVPMLARFFADRLGLPDGADELVVESVAVAPARTIGMLVRDCPMTVYSDGLMSYSPTRDELAAEIGQRTHRLLHLDLVPEVTPLLLHENEPEHCALPDPAFLKIAGELPDADVGDAAGCPVIAGQYLAQLGLLSLRAELALHDDMLTALAARGHDHVVFRPHPAAGRVHVRPLRERAKRLGVRLTVSEDGLPAEVWIGAARPSLVVSCFSTALLTAARFYGAEIASMGTGTVLDRLTPYENSNRIPLTIVDAAVPRLHRDGRITPAAVDDLEALVRAVAYCMQPNRLADLRDEAAEYLRAHGTDRYFVPRRLEAVGFVVPPPYRSVPARRAVRAGRKVLTQAAAVRR